MKTIPSRITGLAGGLGLIVGIAACSPMTFSTESAPSPALSSGSGIVETVQEVPPDVPSAAAPPTRVEVPVPAEQRETVLPHSVEANDTLRGVIRLLQAGVAKEVILAHIESSDVPFDLGAEEIVYLVDLGAESELITAMIERDRAIHNRDGLRIAARTQAATDEDSASPLADPVDVEAVAQESAVVGEPAPANGGLTVNYFHDVLAPYGTWINIDGYGLCWQPSVHVSNPSWKPYCDRGRWIYSNLGWYWYSDYSWGWATFHYGRWFCHDRWGWCWVPGTVWGPSWVCWRYSDPYCGWAPLPPSVPYTSRRFSVSIGFGIPYYCYTFVPVSRVCYYRPSYCAVPYSRAQAIYQNSTVYNNYIVGDNNTIVNDGIPPELLIGSNRDEIRTARIQNVDQPPPKSGRGEQLDRNEGTLVSHRPIVETPSRPQSVSAENGVGPGGRDLEARGPARDTVALTAPSGTRLGNIPRSKSRSGSGKSVAPSTVTAATAEPTPTESNEPTSSLAERTESRQADRTEIATPSRAEAAARPREAGSGKPSQARESSGSLIVSGRQESGRSEVTAAAEPSRSGEPRSASRVVTVPSATSPRPSSSSWSSREPAQSSWSVGSSSVTTREPTLSSTVRQPTLTRPDTRSPLAPARSSATWQLPSHLRSARESSVSTIRQPTLPTLSPRSPAVRSIPSIRTPSVATPSRSVARPSTSVAVPSTRVAAPPAASPSLRSGPARPPASVARPSPVAPRTVPQAPARPSTAPSKTTPTSPSWSRSR